MVLKLYGSMKPESKCTQRVLIILKEKNVPFEVHAIDSAKGENKTPEYLVKQPFGQFPCIDDDGFILFESRAIASYIALKYADQGTPGLIPTELKARALYDQAVSIETSNFDVFAVNAVIEKLVKPYHGLPPDDAAAAKFLEGLDGKLDGYEAILSKQKYLAGNHVTLADLFHLPYGSMLPILGSNLLESEARPNVARWWKDISSRPSWLAVRDGIKF